MRLKDASVNIRDLTPAMAVGLGRVEAVYRELLEMVVTSGRDGQHMAGSKHDTGEAVDIRTRTLSAETAQAFRAAVHATLGRDFDVVLEQDHLHVEYDPKPDPTTRA